MPSWNIHTAHVERLLSEADPSAYGIRDANAFLFGNLLPDVYVGYMVPNVSKKIAYTATHYAEPNFVPTPHFMDFWRECVEIAAEATPEAAPMAPEAAPAAPAAPAAVSDVVLGAWCHLMADYAYNANTNAFLVQHHIAPGEQTRVRKQADFDKFGRTLDISLVPQVTEGLLVQCAAFPQYEVLACDVYAAVESAKRIVEKNVAYHVDHPRYSMLNEGFFSGTFDQVHMMMCNNLRRYAAGELL